MLSNGPYNSKLEMLSCYANDRCHLSTIIDKEKMSKYVKQSFYVLDKMIDFNSNFVDRDSNTMINPIKISFYLELSCVDNSLMPKRGTLAIKYTNSDIKLVDDVAILKRCFNNCNYPLENTDITRISKMVTKNNAALSLVNYLRTQKYNEDILTQIGFNTQSIDNMDNILKVVNNKDLVVPATISEVTDIQSKTLKKSRSLFNIGKSVKISEGKLIDNPAVGTLPNLNDEIKTSKFKSLKKAISF